MISALGLAKAVPAFIKDFIINMLCWLVRRCLFFVQYDGAFKVLRFCSVHYFGADLCGAVLLL